MISRRELANCVFNHAYIICLLLITKLDLRKTFHHNGLRVKAYESLLITKLDLQKTFHHNGLRVKTYESLLMPLQNFQIGIFPMGIEKRASVEAQR
jgi:hypothetical protein